MSHSASVNPPVDPVPGAAAAAAAGGAPVPPAGLNAASEVERGARLGISRVRTFVLQGIDAQPCEVEVDLTTAQMPRTTIVGLPDVAVRESAERVRTAVRNSGFAYPRARVTINLAPADIPKEGPVYDLPIAVALLRAAWTIAPAPGAPSIDEYLVAGELALDGRVRPIRGVISLALLAVHLGVRGVIVPRGNGREAAAVGGVPIFPVQTLGEVVAMFNGSALPAPEPPVDIGSLIAATEPVVDFAEVRGQAAAKRALVVAAAGGHNILLIGPPGTGKSLIARALGGVLPPMTTHEVLEVTRIYSAAGQVPPQSGLVLHRPVRAPHHTASAAAIIGGGSLPRPGEVSLAHRGVLFLDEMAEFARGVLETLRQPMEDGTVTIARARGSVRFPARFMLVGALNPTPRGDGPQGESGRRAMDRYLGRLSRPLVDRIDIHVEVPPVPYRLLSGGREEVSTAVMRGDVARAREFQHRRQGPLVNGELSAKALSRLAPIEGDARTLLGQAMTELHLSARAYDKIRRMARTIADLEGSGVIATHHVAEAVQYRLLDRNP